METNKLIQKLGIVFIIATIVFAGAPAVMDFILIMNDKKQDFTFKHDHVVLGVGLATGLLMIISPGSIVGIVTKFFSK
jgi:hypothetical protein